MSKFSNIGHFHKCIKKHAFIPKQKFLFDSLKLHQYFIYRTVNIPLIIQLPNELNKKLFFSNEILNLTTFSCTKKMRKYF